MKKGHMIQDYRGGYWSSDRNKFGGVLYADFFNSKEEAEGEVGKILSNDKNTDKFPIIIVDAYK